MPADAANAQAEAGAQVQHASPDVIVYSGPIDRNGYHRVSEACLKATADRCLLVLTTNGGDPHAGYRIARALRHHYNGGLTIYVPARCKSAGTLICIATDELVIDNLGELGPLDIQVQKNDEILENSSGLDVSEAMYILLTRAQKAVQDTLVDLRVKTGLGTKVAGSLATELVTNLYAEIFAQIDPMKLGELQRATRIAFDYGERLNAYKENLKPGALGRLIWACPEFCVRGIR